MGAAMILWVAIGTDLLDGFLARRGDQVSALGGLLDHSADAVFVIAMLMAGAYLGYLTYVLPVMVAAAFTQYMLDSRALAGQPLRASSLGRYNGICYFVLGGLLIMEHALSLYPVPLDWYPWLAWGLVISTAISMIDRAVALARTTLQSH